MSEAGEEHEEPPPLERAPGASGVCAVEGLPIGASLGSLEALMLPLCTGPIIAIGRTGHTTALLEFSSADDASTCSGNHKLLGHTVTVQRRDAALAAAAAQAQAPDSHPDEGEDEEIDGQGKKADGAASANGSAQKRQKTESKREKERRLNRVGLSYRCGKCGQPKKGHICPGDVEGANGSVNGSVDGDGGQSTGIFGSVTGLGDNCKPVEDKGTKQEPRRRRGSSEAKPAPEPVVEDVLVMRPPAVITPDEAEEAEEADQLHKIPAGPSSVNSDMPFSPGILMNQLLMPSATSIPPTPHVPVLSPGSISELGNLLQARKREQAS